LSANLLKNLLYLYDGCVLRKTAFFSTHPDFSPTTKPVSKATKIDGKRVLATDPDQIIRDNPIIWCTTILLIKSYKTKIKTDAFFVCCAYNQKYKSANWLK
jgi:hypothetical protein